MSHDWSGHGMFPCGSKVPTFFQINTPTPSCIIIFMEKTPAAATVNALELPALKIDCDAKNDVHAHHCIEGTVFKMRKNDNNNNNTLFMVQYILIVPFKTESSHVDPRDSNKLYKLNV